MDSRKMPIVENSRKQKVVTFCSHFVVLFILIFFPEIVMNISDEHRTDIPTHIYVKSLLLLIVFYVNYYVIIDRCFDRRNSKLRLAVYNTLLMTVMLAVCYLLWELEPSHHHPDVYHGHGPGIHPLPPPDGHVHDIDEDAMDFQRTAHFICRYVRDAVMIVLVMFLALALKLRSRWANIQHYREQLEAYQRKEELKTLKKQLNPHFLFNVLNSVYALIAVNQEKAQYAVHELSNMLRYILYENPSTVPLSKEVKFINNYMALMRLRFSDKSVLRMTMDIDDGMQDAEIAPMMFIVIIENIFKHGVTGDVTRPVEITVSAHDGVVRCRTFNYYDTINPKKETTGIGLSNLRHRIDLIYGDSAELKTDVTGNTFAVELAINLNNKNIN